MGKVKKMIMGRCMCQREQRVVMGRLGLAIEERKEIRVYV